MTTTDTPRVYVACLASYNAGTLHGRWIDATDADEIREEIRAMLRESPNPNVFVDCPDCDGVGCKECRDSGKVPSAEEYAIHDYEGFGEIALSEYEDIDRVAELGAMIEKHGAAFAAFAGHVGAEWATAEAFEESFRGEWDSELAYAEETFDELYAHDIPENLRLYIDYEAFSRDLLQCGDMFSVTNPDGGVFVFESI